MKPTTFERFSCLVPQEGFEPPQAVPKTAVLSITQSGRKCSYGNPKVGDTSGDFIQSSGMSLFVTTEELPSKEVKNVYAYSN